MARSFHDDASDKPCSESAFRVSKMYKELGKNIVNAKREFEK